MDFWIYLIAISISYLGILGGLWQIFIAPEELVPGRKYFKQLLYVLLGFTLSSILFYFFKNYYVSIVCGIGLYLILLFFYTKTPLLEHFIYPFLGLIVGLVSSNQNWFLLISGLVLLIGFPFGSLSIKEYRKRDRFILTKRALIFNLGYFLVAIIFYFI